MVYSETGCKPLYIDIKVRMITFWHRLISSDVSKISKSMYLLLHKMFSKNVFENPWLKCIVNILNECGLSHIWLNQGIDVSSNWLKNSVKQILNDQYYQKWLSDINTLSTCVNYRIFKENVELEYYLIKLPFRYRVVFSKFRCRNHKLPVITGIYNNVDRDNRICTHCNEVGDEYHYIFKCPIFKKDRKTFLKHYYCEHHSTYKMQLLFCEQGSTLINLCKFIEKIVKFFNELRP